MQALEELAGDAQGSGVAGAGWVANLDEAGGGLIGNAEGQRAGAAHQQVGGVAVDQNGGQGRANGAEIRAGQLDLASGQSGGGHNVVDARRAGR